MMDMASQIVVLVFGVVICVLSVWGIFVPQKLMKWVTETMDKNWGLYLAVIVRVVLGSALILAAPGSLYPSVFLVLGWIAIAAHKMGRSDVADPSFRYLRSFFNAQVGGFNTNKPDAQKDSLTIFTRDSEQIR